MQKQLFFFLALLVGQLVQPSFLSFGQENSSIEVKNVADAVWERQLQKIEIETQNKDQKTIFHTALYHTTTKPNRGLGVSVRFEFLKIL